MIHIYVKAKKFHVRTTSPNNGKILNSTESNGISTKQAVWKNIAATAKEWGSISFTVQDNSIEPAKVYSINKGKRVLLDRKPFKFKK